jgi:hypothetical protein
MTGNRPGDAGARMKGAPCEDTGSLPKGDDDHVE